MAVSRADYQVPGTPTPPSPRSHPHTPDQTTDNVFERLPSPSVFENEASRLTDQPSFNTDTDNDTDHSNAETFSQLPIRLRTPSTITPSNRSATMGSSNNLPPMQRAYSSPGVDSTGRLINPNYSAPRRPSSPLSSGRRRSPLRTSFEELYPSSYSGLSIEPNIPENAELELSSPVVSEDGLGPLAPIPTYSNTFPRSRRRPTSPLQQSASAPSLHVRSASPHHSGGTSPSLSASRFSTELYPSYSSTSSMPSTPTSFRSRSPSISSLETIEDIPDAEEAAMLEAEEAKLRGEDLDGSTDSRRRSLDLRGSGLRSNKERKRWSVCGAERRADFSLEPIEE